jgi:hypothetical protein
MIRHLAFFCMVTLMFASAAFAQSSSFGFLLGGSETLEDGLDLNLGNSVREVFFSTDLELGTAFRIKAGQTDADDVDRSGKIEYIQALIDYRFHEIFGSTSLFLGPALYRHTPTGELDDETEYGLSGGVNGEFPFTRRIAFLAELSYHWVNFEEPYRFLTATGGVKLSF